MENNINTKKIKQLSSLHLNVGSYKSPDEELKEMFGRIVKFKGNQGPVQLT